MEDDLYKKIWQVVIIGAGPAGATAAIHLAAKGHEVLLLDKENFPREKVCGDGLSLDCINILKKFGLFEQVRTKGYQISKGSFYTTSGKCIDLNITLTTLKRRHLDSLLVNKALGLGTIFRKATVENIIFSNNQVILKVKKSDAVIRAKICLVATGANVNLIKRINPLYCPKPTAIALRCYVRSKTKLDRFIISFARNIIPGYSWIFPLGKNEYNIGCCVVFGSKINLKQAFQNFLLDFPVTRKIIEGVFEITRPRGSLLRCNLTDNNQVIYKNLMVIGEAAGSTLPLLYEGIGKAMETAELAASVVHKSLVSDNPSILEEFTFLLDGLKLKHNGYTIAQKWFSNPWLIDLMAWRANNSEFAKKSFLGILNEQIDPKAIFSASGVIRSFFS